VFNNKFKLRVLESRQQRDDEARVIAVRTTQMPSTPTKSNPPTSALWCPMDSTLSSLQIESAVQIIARWHVRREHHRSRQRTRCGIDAVLAYNGRDATCAVRRAVCTDPTSQTWITSLWRSRIYSRNNLLTLELRILPLRGQRADAAQDIAAHRSRTKKTQIIWTSACSNQSDDALRSLLCDVPRVCRKPDPF